jgi:hypothetical protein
MESLEPHLFLTAIGGLHGLLNFIIWVQSGFA